MYAIDDDLNVFYKTMAGIIQSHYYFHFQNPFTFFRRKILDYFHLSMSSYFRELLRTYASFSYWIDLILFRLSELLLS